MARYNRYDTALITLYALGKDDLVPMHLRELVPNSTASEWRKLRMDALVGHELRAMHHNALDMQAILAQHQCLRRTVQVVMKVWLSTSDALLPVLHKSKALNQRVVNAVQLLFTVMPRRRAYRLVGLSASAFHDRLARIKAQCGLSPIGRCFKRHPLQLAAREVAVIKDLFNTAVLANWPASSRYHAALRAGRLSIGMCTFYKYLGILGLKAARFAPMRKTQGFVATRPNEFLHVDTTEWPLADEAVAIALVSDNFSKAILGWSVSLRNNADNVITALNRAIATMLKHHPNEEATLLVSDGGPENNAADVKALLEAQAHPVIRHIIAQKDIRFSNSPIEAVNKIMKGYLRNLAPTLQATEQVVAFATHDYTEVRPHGSLKGAIPMERYLDPGFTPAPPDLKAARTQRIAENRKANCRLENKRDECRPQTGGCYDTPTGSRSVHWRRSFGCASEAGKKVLRAWRGQRPLQWKARSQPAQG
ncbi:MAG: DDE-type integrase/transposase/recombinase [Flavobacteriales bacterium]|nr:DDE-type integrase/transposase/recombinase [Flavobacteriales bacterium]